MSKELNAKQVAAIGKLVDGKSKAEVTRELDISEEDLSAWHVIPAFVAKLNLAKQEAYAVRCERLSAMATRSLSVIEDLLKSEDERIRQSSALAVLRLASNLPNPEGPTTVEGVMARRRQDAYIKSLVNH